MAFGALALAAFGLVWLNATGHAVTPPTQASGGPSPAVAASASASSGAGPVGAAGPATPRIVYVTAPGATASGGRSSKPASSPARPSPTPSTSGSPQPSTSTSSVTSASPSPSASPSSAVLAAAVAAAVTPTLVASVGLEVLGITVGLGLAR